MGLGSRTISTACCQWDAEQDSVESTVGSKDRGTVIEFRD